MPYTMEQFKQDALNDLAEWDELQRALAPEILKRMPAEKLLEHVSRSDIEAYLRQLDASDRENGDKEEDSG